MHPSLIECTSFTDLKNKSVINLCDGSTLGCICDIELNPCTGQITAIILPGNGILASFSSKNRIVVPWCDIERIGKDTILVRASHTEEKKG